jgi:predicted nuclease of predicted toxin-antitoxin system
VRFLVDENLSPTLVDRLHERGHVAEHVSHRGLGGSSDPELWIHAYAQDQIIVTINAEDFLELAAESVLHAGLIVLRSQGLTRQEQWAWLEAAVRYLEARDDNHLVNRVLEIRTPGAHGFTDRPLPDP